MDIFNGYRLLKEDEGYALMLYLSSNHTEFSEEICSKDPEKCRELNQDVEEYVKDKFPDLKIKLVKVIMGSMLVASFTLGTPQVKAAEATSSTYTVVSGDSLSVIAKRFNTTVEGIKSLNNLTTDIIQPNQVLKIPSTVETISYTNYTVVSGDSLSVIAKRFNTTVDSIRLANNLTSDLIRVGQVLRIPTTVQPATVSYTVVAGDSLSVIAARFNTTVTEILHLNKLSSTTIYAGQTLLLPAVQTTTPAPDPATSTYKVSSGDSLWSIASRFNTTIDNLRAMNNLTTSIIYVGQVLTVPSATTSPAPVPSPAPTPAPAPAPAPEPVSTAPTVSYINHTVVSGENPWIISINYGIPMSELLRVNNFTESTVLSIGQIIRVPVHTIPVTSTPGPQYGEYLDWWTQAQYVFPINKTARVIDFKTGRSFNVKRTIGANHSDTEPLTSADAAIIKEIWGGTYSWSTRAVIVEVDGRRIAASMTSMPHGIEYIGPNSFDGHFDIHFLNSTRHNDGTIDTYHQTQIRIAAGVK